MSRIPLLLLTGFLGAGKTTLVNRLLGTEGFRDTAVVINEAGDVGLDHLLVEEADDGVMLLEGGCLCCRMRGGLAPALAALLRRRRADGSLPFARVLVETSGLADPAPILEGLVADPVFNRRFALAGIACVVDARAFRDTLAAHGEARLQVALADRILVTKADLVDEAALAAVVADLTALNSAARLQVVPPAGSGPADFWLHAFDLPAFDLPAFDLFAPDLAAPPSGIRPRAVPAVTAGAAVAVASRGFAGGLDAGALEAWLDHTLGLFGPRLIRLKAMVAVEGEPGPMVLHAVRGLLHAPVDGARWPAEGPRNRVVLFATDVEPQLLDDALARLAAMAEERASAA